MDRKIIKTEDVSVIIAQSEYDNTHKGFKGVWTTERYDFPNWDTEREKYIGKRTWMPPFSLLNTSCLLVEGQNFEIVSDEEFDMIAKKQK